MENFFLHLLNMSLTAGVLVVVVMLLRVVFHKAPRWIHCLLWALVAVRLLCPFTIESHLSLMPDTPAVSLPAPAPDAPPVADTPVMTPVPDTPTVTPPAVDTPPMTVIPPVTDTPSAPDASLSAPTPEESADPWQIALTVAAYAWLAGVVMLAAYALFTTLRLRRQVGEAAHLEGNLWQCDHIRSPFILGVFRPRIYLPSDLSGGARDSVVAHEQAHLHRRDHWWKPLGFLLLTVYWFNPLMWVAYIFLCRDIEAACDERVVRNMNAADRKAYSEALLSCSAPRRLVSACPLAFGETSVKSRIKSVLSYKKPTIWIIVAALLVSTVAGVCLLTDRPADKPDSDDSPSLTDKDGNSVDRTAPLGITHVIRTGMIDTGFIEYFGSSDVQQFTSRADLLAFLNARHEGDMLFIGVDWQISEFDRFDDTFFADNVLLLTYHGTSSGMIVPDVVGYTYAEDGTVLSIEFVEYCPYGVTDDLGAWLMFSGIKKTDLEGVTELKSHFSKRIPTEAYAAAFTEPTEYPETATEKWREFYGYEAGGRLREILTRLNSGEWVEDSSAINRALNFMGCVWIEGDIYYVTDLFDGIMSTDGKVGWLTAEESVRVSWLFDEKEDPSYTFIGKVKKVDGDQVLMECLESEWLTGDVWVDFSRFSKVRVGETFEITYDYMEVTDPPRVTPINVKSVSTTSTTDTTTSETKPTTAKPTAPAKVTFVEFSHPSTTPYAFEDYSLTQYMSPIQPDAATCEWLRTFASRTGWFKKDTYFGAYDAYFTIGEDENYYYIDRVNQVIHHNRRFLSLTKEELSKLDALIRGCDLVQYSRPALIGSTVDWEAITGTAQEYVKGEDGYILLKVDYQFRDRFGETVKVSTRFMPQPTISAANSAICVVYDGEYIGDPGTLDRKTIYAHDVDILSEDTIVSTGIPLYDDLLRQIQTHFYDRSTAAPDCSAQIFENPSALVDVGIKLIDLDNNGQKELVIAGTGVSSMWSMGLLYDVYTIQNQQLVHILCSTEFGDYDICRGFYIVADRTESMLKWSEKYYRVENGQLVFVEGVAFDVEYAKSVGLPSDDAFFRIVMQDGVEMYEPITEAQSEDISKSYVHNDGTFRIDGIPFSL